MATNPWEEATANPWEAPAAQAPLSDPWEAPPPEPKQASTGYAGEFRKRALAPLETAHAVIAPAIGFAASVPIGLWGAANYALSGAQKGSESIEKAHKAVEGVIGREYVSDEGKAVSGAVNKFFGLFSDAADYWGQKTLEVTKDPALAATVSTLFNILPLAAPLLKKSTPLKEFEAKVKRGDSLTKKEIEAYREDINNIAKEVSEKAAKKPIETGKVATDPWETPPVVETPKQPPIEGKAAEATKPQVAGKTPVPPEEGEIKPHRTAQRIERQSIVEELSDKGFGEEIAGYVVDEGMMQRQADLGIEIMDRDWNAAVRMALGEEKAPEGVYPGTMITAVSKRALENGDIDLLHKLGTTKEAHTAAQEIAKSLKSFDQKISDNPIDAMQEVSKVRADLTEKTTGKKVNQTKLTAEVTRLEKELAETKQKFDEHTAKTSIKEADAGIENLIKEESAPKTVPYGTKNTLVTKDRYTTLRDELRKQLGSQLSAGIDPTIAAKLTEIGVYHLEAGARKFKVWSEKMVGDFGTWIKPQLADLWGKTKEAFRKENITSIASKMKKGATEGMELPEMGLLVQKLAKYFVAEGVTKRDTLVKEVHAVLKDIMPDITERETRDAISGYGKYKLLSKDEVSVKLRDLKGQLQQISKLEDLKAKEPLQKTGIERRIPSKEESILVKQVNEAKKKYGIAGEEGRALKTLKTRLQNEIDYYKEQQRTLDFTKKERRTTTLDEEGQRLKEKHDLIKNTHQALAESGTVTREEATMLVNLSRQVTQARAEMGQVGRMPGAPQTPQQAAYGAAKVAYHNYVRVLKGEDVPLKKLIENRLKETKVTWGDNKAKAIWDMVKDTVQVLTDNSIAMVATLDNSFLGRQGIRTLMTHPTAWWPGAKNSFIDFVKTVGGKNAHDLLMADIYSRENYLNGEYHKAKILPKSEEQYPATLPERIPGVGRVFKASEYAFTGSAIRMRTDLYDLLAKRARENGVNMKDKVNVEGLGLLINSLTARGKWGERGEPPIVRIILWAPKMLKANIDVLTMHGFGAGLPNAFLRKQAAINLLKIVGETATLMMVANALIPGSAEYNPTSTDFGKIKPGKRPFDITGGAASLITLASRIATGSYKDRRTGRTIKYEPGFGKRVPWDVFEDFLVNKTSPPSRVVVDWLKMRDWEGKKFELHRALYKASTPIAVQNVIDLKDDASADAVAGVILDGLGLSSSPPIKKR